MSFIYMILIGFIVGLIARAVKPGRDKMGFIMTSLLGILGSLFAGVLGRAMGIYAPGEPVGFIASIIGAICLLVIIQYVRGRR